MCRISPYQHRSTMALVVPSSFTRAMRRPVRRRGSIPLLFCFLVVVATWTALLPTALAAKRKVAAKNEETANPDALDATREFLEHPLFHAGSKPIATRQLADLMNNTPFFGKITFEDVQQTLRNIASCIEGGKDDIPFHSPIRLKNAKSNSRLHQLNNWFELKLLSKLTSDALEETLQAQRDIWNSDRCKQTLQPSGFFTRSKGQKKRRNQFVFSFLVHRAFVEWLQMHNQKGFSGGLGIFFHGAMNSFETSSKKGLDHFLWKLVADENIVVKRFEEIFFSDLHRTAAANELNRLLRLQWKDLPLEKQKIFENSRKEKKSQSEELEKAWAKLQNGKQHFLKVVLRKSMNVLGDHKAVSKLRTILVNAVTHFATEERQADRVSLAATCAATNGSVVNSFKGLKLEQPDVYIYKYNQSPKKDCLHCRANRLQEFLYPTRLQEAFKHLTEPAAQSLRQLLPRHCFAKEALHALDLNETDFYKMSTNEMTEAALNPRPPIVISTSVIRSPKTPHISVPAMLTMGPSSAVLLSFLRTFNFVRSTPDQRHQALTDAGLFMVASLAGDAMQEYLAPLREGSFYPKETEQK